MADSGELQQACLFPESRHPIVAVVQYDFNPCFLQQFHTNFAMTITHDTTVNLYAIFEAKTWYMVLPNAEHIILNVHFVK